MKKEVAYGITTNQVNLGQPRIDPGKARSVPNLIEAAGIPARTIESGARLTSTVQTNTFN